VKILGSIIGPYASIGDDCVLENAVVKNCIVQHNTTISKAYVENAMLGSHVNYHGEAKDLSIGDYTTVQL
jgi:glucose-1-phosphate thymidylyltransferase